METLRISQVRHGSFAEGPRCNTTIWLAGCSIRCPGCFNPELWDPLAGEELNITEILQRISAGMKNGDNGLALVGGEPFDQPVGLAALLTAFKARYPLTPVTLYSGFRIETLRSRKQCLQILDLADALVDGPFLIDQEDQDLGYRGSDNQRVIDLSKSRQSKYTRLHILRWDKLIAFLPDGSLAGASPTLSIFTADENAVCGYQEKSEDFGQPISTQWFDSIPAP